VHPAQLDVKLCWRAAWFGPALGSAAILGGPARMGWAMALRKRFVFGLIAAACLLVAAGVVAALLTTTGGHKSASQGNVPAAKFNSAQQVRLERGLTAPGIAAQSTVVAAEIRAQFVGRGRPLLPADSRVRIEPATFDATSAKTATVDAAVTGPDSGRWQLLLVSEGGNWLLLGTRKLP
jgi:hypothetical protein